LVSILTMPGNHRYYLKDMVQYKLAEEGGVVDLEEYRKEGHAHLGANPNDAREP